MIKKKNQGKRNPQPIIIRFLQLYTTDFSLITNQNPKNPFPRNKLSLLYNQTKYKKKKEREREEVIFLYITMYRRKQKTIGYQGP